MQRSHIETVKKLLMKYKQQWAYLVVGGCTTVINYAVYFLLIHLGVYYILSNVLSWVCAVIFAYFANGAWVYKASSKRSWKEAGTFVLSRLFSLGLETLLLFLMVDAAHFGKNASKLIVAVVVVVVNYLTGLLVYKVH